MMVFEPRSIWDHLQDLELFFLDFSEYDDPLITMSIYVFIGLTSAGMIAFVSVIITMIFHYVPLLIEKIRIRAGLPGFIVRIFIKPGQEKKMVMGIVVSLDEDSTELLFTKPRKKNVNDYLYYDWVYKKRKELLKIAVL